MPTARPIMVMMLVTVKVMFQAWPMRAVRPRARTMLMMSYHQRHARREHRAEDDQQHERARRAR